MSSANRNRRRQNRDYRLAAAEEALRRSRRQRIVLTAGGLVLAVAIAVVLVSRASDNGGKSASTTTTSAASTSSTASTTTTTLASAAGKPCVGLKDTLPAGTPNVPILPGPAPTKLVKLDLKVGTGAVVKAHATITVNYVGVACSTGKLFGSTFGQPGQALPLDGFVPGWRNGIPGMRVGGQRLLGIPAALAYGAQSPPGTGIAPNETLWFVVQVDKTA